MTKKVPGVAVLSSRASSTGHHTDHRGIGEASISIRKPDGTWVDLLEIWFQDMDATLLEELELDYATAPNKFSEDFSPVVNALGDAKRRLSKTQALWLTEKISAYIQSLGYIPSDQEIHEDKL